MIKKRGFIKSLFRSRKKKESRIDEKAGKHGKNKNRRDIGEAAFLMAIEVEAEPLFGFG